MFITYLSTIMRKMSQKIAEERRYEVPTNRYTLLLENLVIPPAETLWRASFFTFSRP